MRKIIYSVVVTAAIMVSLAVGATQFQWGFVIGKFQTNLPVRTSFELISTNIDCEKSDMPYYIEDEDKTEDCIQVLGSIQKGECVKFSPVYDCKNRSLVPLEEQKIDCEIVECPEGSGSVEPEASNF